MRSTTLIPLVFVALGCAPHENPAAPQPKPAVEPEEPVKPEPETVEEPEPEPVPVVVSVASVQLSSDCPDKPAPNPTAAPAALDEARGDSAEAMPRLREGRGVSQGKRGPPGPGDSAAVPYPPPCAQSWLQLAFVSTGKEPIDAAIRNVRVLAVGTEDPIIGLQTRAPSVWDTTHGYLPWDEKVPPGDSKASYKLGSKDWPKVDRLVASGRLYEVEVEIDVGGELRTIRSSALAKAAEQEFVT